MDIGVRDAGGDEIALGLDHRQVVVRAALQQERSSEAAQVRLLDHVQPDVLGQDLCQACHDLVRLPAQLLEVRDVLLQEDGAAVVEGGGPLGPKGQLRELGDVEPEASGGALEKVAIAGRALGVQLEVLHPAVLHDDDFDVLAAHISDDVHVGVVAQGRLRVGHRLRYGDVGAQGLLHDVLGVAGGARAPNANAGALALHLLP